MSCRNRHSLIKGVSPDQAKALIAEAVRACPGPPPKNSKWSDWQYIPTPTQFSVLSCADSLVLVNDAYFIANEIARATDLPHMELRVQEGDDWDFTLWHHSQVVADFSTKVSYFDDDPCRPRPWKQGDGICRMLGCAIKGSCALSHRLVNGRRGSSRSQ